MKLLVLAVLLVTVLAMPAVAVDWTTCPLNGHQYTLVQASSWTDAENQAIVLGGHLVTIRNQTENDWVYNWTLSVSDDSVYRAWIGLYQLPNSVEPAGGWVWASGEPFLYNHWPAGEPNNSGGVEGWAQMYIRQHDWDESVTYWNDTIVDRPATPVGIVEVTPEPSSLLAIGGGLIGLVSIIRRKK